MNRFVSIIFAILAVTFTTGCVAYQPTRPVVYTGPPQVAVVQPQTMYYLPRYRVYYVPDIPGEIFYYDGYWYYRSATVYYMGTTYNGPWTQVEVRIVPTVIINLPRDYRSGSFPHERVPYGHWERRDRDEGEGRRGTSYIDAVRDAQRRAEPEPPPPPPGRDDDRRPPAYGRDQDRPGKGPARTLPRTPFPRPPRVRFLPAYSIYYIPGITIEIVFFDGAWYQRHEGRWYRGNDYDGPWTLLEDRQGPGGLDRLPPRYREDRYDDVPYGHWERKDRDRGEGRPGPEDRSTYVDAVKDAREREKTQESPKEVLFPRERSFIDAVKEAREREQPPAEPPADRSPETPPMDRDVQRDRDRQRDQDREREREDRRPDVTAPSPARPEPPGRTDRGREKPEPPTAAPGPPDTIGQLKIEKPKMVSFMPGLGIYYIPGIDEEIFYHDGSWYFHRQGAWYSGRDHNGPWKLMDQGKLPPAIRGLPGQYRTQPTQTVPYGAWEENGKGRKR